MLGASDQAVSDGGLSMPGTGDLIDGKYCLGPLIGRGGMGAVYAARHQLLEQAVAIKLLAPHLAGASPSQARFFNEARAAAGIKSDHVCRVLDFGLLPSGSPYLVMEKLDGEDLAQAIASRGPLPIIRAVDYVLQALEAVAEAHALGIVHRDLKPANLFVARRPDGSTRIKVLDFGISKLVRDGASASLTVTAVPLGSPAYMSPEQVRNPKDVDSRTDLWSMGVILYEMLAGQAPFAAATAGEILAQVLEQEPPPLRSRRSDVTPGLDQVLSRCLRRDRGGRYQDASELAAALVAFGSTQAPVSLERIRGVIQSASATRSGPVLEAAAPSRPVTAAKRAWGAGARMAVAAVCLAAGVAGAAVARRFLVARSSSVASIEVPPREPAPSAAAATPAPPVASSLRPAPSGLAEAPAPAPTPAKASGQHRPTPKRVRRVRAAKLPSAPGRGGGDAIFDERQ